MYVNETTHAIIDCFVGQICNIFKEKSAGFWLQFATQKHMLQFLCFLFLTRC